MTTSSSKIGMWLLAALSLALLGASVLALSYIRSQSEEAWKLSDQADQAAQAQATAESVRSIQQNNKDDIAALQSLALSDESLVAAIDSIEKKGRSLGLKAQIASVNKEAGSGSGSPQKVDISVSSDGSWAGSYSFLQALESMPNRVSVDSVDLSKGESGWSLKADISLYLFN